MGRSKAWLPFGNETMLQRVIRLLRKIERFQNFVVVRGAGQALPPLPSEILVVEDRVVGFGPLAGIAAGMAALAATEPERSAAYVSSCDVPLLVPAVVDTICQHLHDVAAVVPTDNQHPHPMAAAYRLDVLPIVEQLIAQGEHRPRCLFDRVKTFYLPVNSLRSLDPELYSFRNVNTPEEYAAALREAGLSG